MAGGASSVEWEPAREEHLRVSLPVSRPVGEIDRILHVEPAELIRLAYGGESLAMPRIVRLRLSRRLSRLEVPVEVDCVTPVTGGAEAGITIRWRAAALEGFFPEMSADLHVQPHSSGGASLVLDARYRPPGGLLGLLVDQLLGRFVAATTAQQFLERLAASIDEPVA